MLLGRARPVEAREEKLAALHAIVEHIAPGRSLDARAPNDKELAGTSVLALPIDEASAKVRSGPAKDFDEDLALPVWAGVLPLRTIAAEAEWDDHVPDGVPMPDYVSDYRR